VKVLVGLSGGVDSAVAAVRLLREGYEVVGAYLRLWDPGAEEDPAVRARDIAASLGIPLIVEDLRKRFREKVFLPSLEASIRGLTPNPCVVCNRSVKLEGLLEAAAEAGAERVATGHYARVVRESGGPPRLLRGTDRRKDQSYFLHRLAPGQLARLLLPLGDLGKEQVRELASTAGLTAADRPESQDLCFVPPGRTFGDVVEALLPGRVRPGPVIGPDGREVGRHGGIHRFTVGQRRGLGVALGAPAYVVALDPGRAAVTLGPPEAAHRRRILVEEPSWLRGRPPPFPLRCTVRVRARHGGAACTVKPAEGERLIVTFDEPVLAPAPGQAAAFHLGDEVLGGGWISREDPG
jgi:tRNA-specific 2-thiouridylase